MGRGASLLASLAVAGIATLVAAGGMAAPLPTARTHILRVRPKASGGVEATMPRGSAYGRGVALDVQGRFEQSAEAYRKAEAEFATAAARGDPRAAAWRVKSRHQRYWSQRLASQHRRRYRRPLSPRAAADEGYTYVEKFLAARAFTGKAPMHLARRGRILLEDAVRRAPHEPDPRLALAFLLHEMGEPMRARQEFSRARLTAGLRPRTSLILRLAAYHAAAGEPDQAMAQLRQLTRRSYVSRRYRELLQCSNEFDRLRHDPRFRKLITKQTPSPPRRVRRPFVWPHPRRP